MTNASKVSNQRNIVKAQGTRQLTITDGEIHFLWSFIQGSIMIPETWHALMRGYGFCERHAWAHISVEMSFRQRYFLAPTILYVALIEKSLQAILAAQHGRYRRTLRHLRSVGPCLLCALDIKPSAVGASPVSRLERGRDSSRLRSFASELGPLWRGYTCPTCSDTDDNNILSICCRQHLIAKSNARLTDLRNQEQLLGGVAEGLARYKASFGAGGRPATDCDRAALIIAIGWCSGWRPLLGLLA